MDMIRGSSGPDLHDTPFTTATTVCALSPQISRHALASGFGGNRGLTPSG